MKEKKLQNKKRRKLLIVSVIGILTVIGGTLAYFTTTTTIKDIFKTAMYQNEITEVFEAPANWTPGTTTDKTVKVTNTGSIDMAVRVSYTEKWITANNKELSLKDDNDEVASIINFNDDWTKDDDGYYYFGSKENKTVLKPGETSTSFMSGVTFNPNIVSSLSETVSQDGKTVTYTSTGNGYDNAQYILIVKLDTIQYDQADNIWG